MGQCILIEGDVSLNFDFESGLKSVGDFDDYGISSSGCGYPFNNIVKQFLNAGLVQTYEAVTSNFATSLVISTTYYAGHCEIP